MSTSKSEGPELEVELFRGDETLGLVRLLAFWEDANPEWIHFNFDADDLPEPPPSALIWRGDRYELAPYLDKGMSEVGSPPSEASMMGRRVTPPPRRRPIEF